jgi:electron transfer flavoprotein alpha subunit
MSVLVFAESHNGHFKKTTLEAVTYGAQVAAELGVPCVALTLGKVEAAGELGVYGASKVYNVASDGLQHFDSQVFTKVIADAVTQLGATVLVLCHSANGKALAGRLSVRLKAGSVAGANAIPSINGSFKVTKSVFSGKAIAAFEITSAVKIISLVGNAVAPNASSAAMSVENLAIEVPAAKVTVKGTQTVEGEVPLPEAELVVSAGRGLKDPSNWGIIEDLAHAVGATTACSRPVADAGWRPHHEHVGQTGVAIRPNLYIAVGISGAIQHLAGVNNSRVIVVINKDPEAPFFKAADYGVVGDLFEIVPKLTEAFKAYHATK